MTRLVAIFVLACALPARADDGIAAAVGATAGGGWTPGGLHLDARYLLALDARDWLDAGVSLTLGGGGAACYADRDGGYACNHGALAGGALGIAIGVRHEFADVGGIQPFARAGFAVDAVRFPDDVVLTMTDSVKPPAPTRGMYGVAVTARAGGGVRWPVSPTLSLTASGELQIGGGGFAGSANVQRQLGFTLAAGAELRSATITAPRTGSLGALAGVAGIYAPFLTWEYYAWYNGAHHRPLWFDTAWHDETPGLETYAGGADKLGHAWIHYTLTRGTTELLVAHGWNKWAASLTCFGIDQLEATFSEMKDGPVWGYEIGDTISNLSGALLAVAMENLPTLDRLFDFRLQYWPSPAYIKLAKEHPFSRGDGLDISQDYTGQSYMLALHLGELPYDHDSPWLRWVEYTDAVVGFEARHYEPSETPVPIKYQTEYVGLAVNMQAVLSALLPDSRGRRIARGIAEFYSLPHTTLRLDSHTRAWNIGVNPPAL